MSGSLTYRVVAAGLIWITCALGIGGWLIYGMFQDSISRLFDSRLEAELELLTAKIADTEANPADQMKNPDFWRVYSGTYWQATAEDGRRYRSRSLWDMELPVPDVVPDGWIYEIVGPGNRPIRILARSLTMPSGTRWTLAVGHDKSALHDEIAVFSRALFLSAGILGGILLTSAFLLLRIALSPLQQLHSAVRKRQVRSGSIEGHYPAEVAPLVEDLNQMLERNERLRERGRRQAANLAHALKTPAAILANELTKADRGEQIDTILSVEAVDRISATAERHLTHANADPEDVFLAGSIDAVPLAQEIARAMRRLYPDRSLEIFSDQTVLVHIPQSEITEILGNILDNAAKWAHRQVRLTLLTGIDHCTITVEDDGPGVPEKDRRRILSEGVRLDTSKPGTGLGLTIVADIVEYHGGQIHMTQSLRGGLKVSVELPAHRNRRYA
ncbi:MAG: sensor histidine kinase [Roseibium sp.]|uniref:sensor histidine kinase n=1 Tax=Roseibium sp. TaxID=1936156 RepID=UPI00263154DE|nr:sensor histidine kinase [Roseibium sp.]MCV0424367.1 sensor histidine kinase [Roseibium sp.]